MDQLRNIQSWGRSAAASEPRGLSSPGETWQGDQPSWYQVLCSVPG